MCYIFNCIINLKKYKQTRDKNTETFTGAQD